MLVSISQRSGFKCAYIKMFVEVCLVFLKLKPLSMPPASKSQSNPAETQHIILK